MGPRTTGLLVMSSALNATLSFFVFAFALFATNPTMQDVTMRIGFYVLNAIGLTGIVSVFAPWIFVRKGDNKKALLFAFLPFILISLVLFGFLTLDSWLNRTFSS